MHAALRCQVRGLLGRRPLHAPVPHALGRLAGLRQGSHRCLAGAVAHSRHQTRWQQLAVQGWGVWVGYSRAPVSQQASVCQASRAPVSQPASVPQEPFSPALVSEATLPHTHSPT